MKIARFVIIEEHMIDTKGVHKASIDIPALQLLTKDATSSILDTFDFTNTVSLKKGLQELADFMNRKENWRTILKSHNL